jgi:hypothetical protein
MNSIRTEQTTRKKKEEDEEKKRKENHWNHKKKKRGRRRKKKKKKEEINDGSVPMRSFLELRSLILRSRERTILFSSTTSCSFMLISNSEYRTPRE